MTHNIYARFLYTDQAYIPVYNTEKGPVRKLNRITTPNT